MMLNKALLKHKRATNVTTNVDKHYEKNYLIIIQNQNKYILVMIWWIRVF